ncbi:putative uncharacterized protein DDB_G0292292 [Anastrepha ludens]|uniref:putative uncharacterized protein DDB_G0292292 n=1 Tax=Anastrepha ludens TaxID=28586 RepID=UPI0023B0E0C2|nr:putative uncharacterized protein DDB_G0292292 [Anastrepha ludens]
MRKILSITDLPPLPKSLSGINKMLGSDSGLISDDADANMEHQTNNDIDDMVEYQKGDNNNNNNNNSNITANNNNNNNIGKSGFDVAKLLESNEMELNNTTGKSKTSNATTTTTATTYAAETTATSSSTTTTTTAASKMATTAATPAKSAVTSNAAGAGGAVASVTGSTLDTQLAILRKEMVSVRLMPFCCLSWFLWWLETHCGNVKLLRITI